MTKAEKCLPRAGGAQPRAIKEEEEAGLLAFQAQKGWPEDPEQWRWTGVVLALTVSRVCFPCGRTCFLPATDYGQRHSQVLPAVEGLLPDQWSRVPPSSGPGSL